MRVCVYIYIYKRLNRLTLVLWKQTDIVPIVMAGIIGIYGLVVSVLIANDLRPNLPLYTGFIQLGAGLSVGLSGLAAGYVFNPNG